MLFKKFFFVSFLFFSTFASATNIDNMHRISIHGIQNIPSQKILQILNHSSLRKNIQNNAVKNINYLFNTKNFTNIRLVKKNNKLIAFLKESPFVEKISFSGNHSFSNEYIDQLLQKFNIQDKIFLNLYDFKNFLFLLNKKYENKGYFNVKYDLQKTLLSKNTINIKIIISENSRSSVVKFNIYGNKYFSKNKLLTSLFYCNRSLFYNNFILQPYDGFKFKKLLIDLRKFYIDHGYLDFKIKEIKKIYSKDKKKINIYINIHEGEKYFIKNLFIYNKNKNCFNKNINEVIKSFKGSPLNNQNISTIKNKIEDIFLKLGFPNISVSLHVDVDRNNKKVFLYTLITLKKRYFIDKISFSGNKYLSQRLLKNIFNHNSRCFFDKQSIKDVCYHLFETDLFQFIKVHITKKLGSINDVNVNYVIQENSKTKNVNMSTNYDPNRGFLLKFIFLEKNIFKSGNEFYLDILKNFVDTNIKLHLLKPLGLFKRFVLKSDAFLNILRNSSHLPHNFANKVFGCCTSLYTPTIRNKTLALSCGYENIRIVNIIPHVSLFRYLSSLSKNPFSRRIKNNFFINDFFIKYIFDFNNIIEKGFYKKGMHMKLIGKFMLPFSDNFYHKIFFNLDQYVPIRSIFNAIFHNHLEVGTGFSSGFRLFPLYENYKFFNSSLKSGFKDNFIGPVAIYYKFIPYINSNKNRTSILKFYPSTDFIGGNMMIHANMELLFPTFKLFKRLFRFFQAGCFLDAINIWDTQWKNSISLFSLHETENFNNPSNTYISTGIFIRWLSFLGPITFVFSNPLLPKDIPNRFINKFDVNFT
ncbi:outer membrane protein assembly factor BamA [Buchnera aphidicola]|uniref:Outer membrane protein assembly factor BamA n=1 Tax=Buchnera aphidicola (Cinara strobi) TaxID=1921549 RepID=A0A3B1E0F6_9GAMM|nr:outer membrane protein assembly factor BamA [Buchnera aphidicola]VAX76465.1 Outer membrane protein assembly factor BamA [Buchnera aphidicola (Cinara strobi)]